MNTRYLIDEAIANAIHAIGSNLDTLEMHRDRIGIADQDDLAGTFQRFGSLMADLLADRRPAPNYDTLEEKRMDLCD